MNRCRITATGRLGTCGIAARIFIQITPPAVFQSIQKALSRRASRISQRLDHRFNIDDRVIVVDMNAVMLEVNLDILYTRLLG